MKIKIRYLLPPLFSLLSIVHCGIFSPDEEKTFNFPDYYPLDTNNVWYYSDNTTVSVTGEPKMVNNELATVVKYAFANEPPRTEYISASGASIRILAADNLTYQPPMRLANKTVKIGEVLWPIRSKSSMSPAKPCSNLRSPLNF
jgi:hypothetical protein